MLRLIPLTVIFILYTVSTIFGSYSLYKKICLYLSRYIIKCLTNSFYIFSLDQINIISFIYGKVILILWKNHKKLKFGFIQLFTSSLIVSHLIKFTFFRLQKTAVMVYLFFFSISPRICFENLINLKLISFQDVVTALNFKTLLPI